MYIDYSRDPFSHFLDGRVQRLGFEDLRLWMYEVLEVDLIRFAPLHFGFLGVGLRLRVSGFRAPWVGWKVQGF